MLLNIPPHMEDVAKHCLVKHYDLKIVTIWNIAK